ncbi:MAG: IclR family transcriptional regulator [Deltaproteobacteria bacterium]|nr:IclR family transcriptional regulator [Deltaproteobacteria bacterium]
MTNKKKSNNAKAVDRAIDVIEFMAAGDRDLSLSDILEGVRIPRQSLIRILNTLCARGILEKTYQRGFYRLGMKLIYLGNRFQDKINLRSMAWPFMQELSQATHKTIDLATFDCDQLILIEQIRGSEPVSLYSRVGSVYPYLHALGAGKVYLAHMEPGKRHSALDKIGLPAVSEKTITDLNELAAELKKVKKNGYAFEDQELRKGVRRIAAPIYNIRGELVGCIGIAATIFSFTIKDKKKLGNMAVETAKKVSSRMGYKAF